MFVCSTMTLITMNLHAQLFHTTNIPIFFHPRIATFRPPFSSYLGNN